MEKDATAKKEGKCFPVSILPSMTYKSHQQEYPLPGLARD
jgi:hypothetical protein